MPGEKFTLDQRIFMYDTYVKTESCREVCRQFAQKFPGVKVPNRDTVRRLVLRLRETGSLNARIRRRKRTVLTEEKLDEIEASLERSPRKSLHRLSQEVGVSKGSAHAATKLFKLKPYRGKRREAKCEDQNETVSPQQMCEFYIPEVIVKVENMDEGEEEEQQQRQQLEEHSLQDGVLKTKQEYEMVCVKEEPNLGDEDVNNHLPALKPEHETVNMKEEPHSGDEDVNGYLPTLKSQECNVQKGRL